MRAPMKATVLLFSAILVLGTFGLASGQDVSVDLGAVVGLDENGLIPEEGTTLTIPIRLTNSGLARSCISNGFVFTSDGVTWGSMTAAWNEAYPWNLDMGFPLFQYPYFDAGLYINFFDANLDLVIPDSIPVVPGTTVQPTLTAYGAYGAGFAGLSNSRPGLPAGFDDVAYSITLVDVNGNPDDVLTIDSSFWQPANVWLWCDDPTYYPTWGGSVDFVVAGGGGGGEPYTDCWPQPVDMGNLINDRVIEFYVYNEDPSNVDLNSLRVGNIPPYNPPQVLAGDVINTDAFVMRFLGASGFRPLPPEGIQSTYTISYNYISGGSNSLVGDFVLETKNADVNLDGVVDIQDVQFMAAYFWAGGEQTNVAGEALPELMDVDGSGEIDIRDAIATIEASGI